MCLNRVNTKLQPIASLLLKAENAVQDHLTNAVCCPGKVETRISKGSNLLTAKIGLRTSIYNPSDLAITGTCLQALQLACGILRRRSRYSGRLQYAAQIQLNPLELT